MVRGRVDSLVVAVFAPILLFVISAAALRFMGRGEVVWANVGRSVEYPALNVASY